MGLIEGFENDIFVSYAHDDNLGFLVREPAEGWVLDFAKALKTGLSAQLKKEIKQTNRELTVFWDKSRLQQGEPLDWELNDHVEKSAIFCIFMSQNYLDSDWCQQELNWFLKTLEGRKDRLSRESEGRLWPVIVVSVSPTNQSDWPDEILKRGMPFEFYDKNENSRDPRYAYPSMLVTSDPCFFEEFTKLETTLSRRIKNALAKETGSGAVVTATDPGKSLDVSIYGSEVNGTGTAVLLCTDDMSQKAKRFEDQCRKAGIDVANPKIDLGSDDPADAVSSAIAGAKAVILLLGVYPGSDEEAMAGVLQAALDRANQDKIGSLVWMQKGLKPTLIDEDFEHYKKFVTGMKSSIISADLNGLQAELEKLLEPADEGDGDKQPERRVKLFIDAAKVDYETARHLRAKLREQNVKAAIYSPQENVDQKTHNEQWRNIVEICDGVILVQGKIDFLALDEKVEQILKAAAKRKQKTNSVISIAIIDTPPPSGFELDEPRIKIISASDENDISGVVDFISGL